MAATEQGSVGEELWEDIPEGWGQEPLKVPRQINRETGETRPKPGHESYIVVHRPPERPA
jgi:hypothetical protein